MILPLVTSQVFLACQEKGSIIVAKHQRRTRTTTRRTSDMEFIKIKTIDDEELKISGDVLRLSKTMASLLLDLKGQESKERETEEPIAMGVDFQFVQDFIVYGNLWLENLRPHQKVSAEEKEASLTDILDWEIRFVEYLKRGQTDEAKADLNLKKSLMTLCLGSNYLHIKPLLSFCAKMIAKSIKGLKADEIIKAYHLDPKDFSTQFKQILNLENGFRDAKE